MTKKEKEAKIATFEKECEEIKKHRKPAGQNDEILVVAQQDYKNNNSELEVAGGQEIKVNRDPELEATIKATLEDIKVEENEKDGEEPEI